MKAVKSELARRLLADPSARVQIRNITTSQRVGTVSDRSNEPTQSTVVVRQDGSQVRYARIVVRKAA